MIALHQFVFIRGWGGWMILNTQILHLPQKKNEKGHKSRSEDWSMTGNTEIEDCGKEERGGEIGAS